jgi:ubiquinone biosynthesis protein UbiJ
MKKTFDCVEMKRKAQEKIYEETKNLSREEELEYFHKAGERFRRELEALREKRNRTQQKKVSKAKSGKRKSTESGLKSKS